MQKDVQLRLPPPKAADEKSIRKALGISSSTPFLILKKSIDARRKEIMVDLICRVDPSEAVYQPTPLKEINPAFGQAIVVGSGPAGLFAALTLLEKGVKPIVLERGKDVHSRRKDIAKISTCNEINPQSNYSFGEGGAGAFSDGKLFTRSKKRGENAKVLNLFVQYGADSSILYEAHPHIGTDKLPKIVENMRNAILSHGGEIHFNTQVVDLLVEKTSDLQVCTGCVAKNLETGELSSFLGPVILAIGNAARDTFEMLLSRNVRLQAKDLAMGVRLEHPQKLIDSIQYHNPNGRGEFLPAAEYSFATQVPLSQIDFTGFHKPSDKASIGVYSFCMCPGGFVVPAASDTEQVVVNGMSPSARGSKWANSGMVVEFPTSLVCSPTDSSDPLCMVKLQKELEKATFQAAGGTQKAPAQRLVDFLKGLPSASLPSSSYAPGLTSTNLRDVLPPYASSALSHALHTFGHAAPGFETNEAILIGSETRTSCPIRIERNPDTLQSVSLSNLYPCGEGAGYAGGIVSAAIDGIRCAQMINAKFMC